MTARAVSLLPGACIRLPSGFLSCARPGWRFLRDVFPGHHQRASERRRVSLRKAHTGGAAFAPSAGHGTENFRLSLDQHGLLLRRQLDHAPVRIGIAEGSEDALPHAEIRRAVMRAFDALGKAESDLAEAGDGHAPYIVRCGAVCSNSRKGCA